MHNSVLIQKEYGTLLVINLLQQVDTILAILGCKMRLGLKQQVLTQ